MQLTEKQWTRLGRVIVCLRQELLDGEIVLDPLQPSPTVRWNWVQGDGERATTSYVITANDLNRSLQTAAEYAAGIARRWRRSRQAFERKEKS